MAQCWTLKALGLLFLFLFHLIAYSNLIFFGLTSWHSGVSFYLKLMSPEASNYERLFCLLHLLSTTNSGGPSVLHPFLLLWDFAIFIVSATDFTSFQLYGVLVLLHVRIQEKLLPLEAPLIFCTCMRPVCWDQILFLFERQRHRL